MKLTDCRSFKAQLILLSGLFFRGKWMNVFNKTFTKQEPFYDTNGNQIGNVNMMFQRGPLAYAAIAEIGCHVIELPYAEAPVSSRGDIYGTGLSMIIVLPRKGLLLTEAIKSVYSFSMNKIYKELYNSKLEYEDEEVEVHLPRFEIQTSLDVKDTLETVSNVIN
jgi:serine protease inhibitor